jgi:hypothetical protein
MSDISAVIWNGRKHSETMRRFILCGTLIHSLKPFLFDYKLIYWVWSDSTKCSMYQWRSLDWFLSYSSHLYLPNLSVRGESYGQGEGSCQRSKVGEERELELGLCNQVQQYNWDMLYSDPIIYLPIIQLLLVTHTHSTAQHSIALHITCYWQPLKSWSWLYCMVYLSVCNEV